MGRPPRNSIGSTSSNATSLASSSNPRELNTNHRKWLARSLDRNDVELAALEKLNKALHSLRQKIIERDGSEEKLLEAASAISKLEHGLLFTEEVEASIDGIRKEVDEKNDTLLKDFYLHMKLRRKILNRFARRLNRLARSMDGETVGVGPPIPPKYGDPPAAIDMKKMEEFAKKRKRLEDYEDVKKYYSILKEENEMKKIKAEDDKNANKDVEMKSASLDSEEKDDNHPLLPDPKDYIEYEVGFKEAYASLAESQSSTDKKKSETPELGVLKYGVGIGAVNRAMSYKEKIAEYLRWEHDLLARIPQQPTFKELDMNVVFNEKERKKQLRDFKEEAESKDDHKNVDNDDQTTEDAEMKDNDESQQNSDNSDDSNDDDSQSDESNKDETSKELKSKDETSLEEKSVEEKSVEETSVEEKSVEETSVEEKSMEDDPEAEKKEVDDSDKESDNDEKNEISIEEEEEEEKEKGSEKDEALEKKVLTDEEEIESKEELKKKKEITKDGAKNKEKDSDGSSQEDESNKETKENEDEKNPETVLQKLKPQVFFSIQAVPSFYNQDLRRVRAVHADLMESTKKAHVQRLVTEATNEYNQALRVSSDLNNLRQKLQGDISRLMYSAQSVQQKRKGDYAVEVAIAKNKWQKRKDIWDRAQKKRLEMMNIVYSGQLKTRVIVEDIVSTMVEKVGYRLQRRPFRNPMITRGDPIREASASILSDMKDTIVTHITAESFTYNPNEKFESFVPPPDESQIRNNNLSMEFQMRQKQIQNDINICDMKLVKSEDERKRAWKRLAKVKAEAAGFSMVARATEHSFPPVPLLKGSKMYTSPALMQPYSHVPVQRQAPVPTKIRTTPAKEYKERSSSDAPKSYSESIKARIFPDGSIKPVMAPKKLKDGSFQRPAGRKRKGMDWDAIRGVWTPSQNPTEGKSQEDLY